MTEAKTTAKTEKNEGQLCMLPQPFGMPNVLMDSSCPLQCHVLSSIYDPLGLNSPL